MVNNKNILDFIDTFAPFSSAAEWDNSGLLVGNENTEITKVILSLDITNEVIKEAKEKGANLIISHHPVIFNPLTKLSECDPVYELAKNNISAICAHTNLDIGKPGVATALADKLELENLEYHFDEFMIVGDLNKEFSSDEFAQYIKDKLNLCGIKYTKGKSIKRVAIAPGGAGEFVFKYFDYNFDAFVTGDIKHHEFLFANSVNISAYQAGHYNTEVVVIPLLQGLLQNQFKEIEFLISETEKDPNIYQ